MIANTLKKIIGILILLSAYFTGNTQVNHDRPTGGQQLMEGISLFEDAQYGSALHIFDQIALHHKRVGFNDISADAEFYAAISALKLENSDAEYRIMNFIKRNPESPRINAACFFMGQRKYQLQDWENTNYWFSRVDRYLLEENERAEYYFKQGYAQLILGKEENANKLFYELLDFPQSDYYGPGVYYYSHIEYTRGNYETALNGFKALKNDPTFSPVAPYYLAHIYFLQEKYELVISYIPTIINKVTPKRRSEMERMLGNAWFKTGNYDSAMVYLEKYKESATNFQRYDLYQLAYAYYQKGKYEDAIGNFAMITNKADSLTQNSNYHLAAAYLKLNDKKNALLAFGNASRLHFNDKIKEDALYNYAKLTYELSFAPFDETIKVFHSYIEQYPENARKNQIYNYLVDVYMTSKNYRAAIESIAKIGEQNQLLNNALQKVAYFHGIELYNNLNYREAIEMFGKSKAANGSNTQINALAQYWSAESLFKLEKYEAAAEAYKTFLTTPGAYNTDLYNFANYNTAYCYFKLNNYQGASIWFRKYLDHASAEQTKINYDAWVRLGDSYFVQRKYNQALSAYKSATEINYEENDYAIFQQGFTAGILNEQQQKISILTPLTTRTQSLLADDALYETGTAYIQLNQPEMGIQQFEQLIEKFPNSNYLKKSYLQAGLMYFNIGKNKEASERFKHIIENFKGTNEYSEALVALKNVYLDQNKVDEFFGYAKTNSINISANEQDSLLYLSAEKAYLNNEEEHSQKLFEEYLQRFSDGQFTLKSHFYLAQILYNTKKQQEALKHYQYIIQQPQNSFTETALYNSAIINSENEKYDEAWTQFNQLETIASNSKMLTEARIGQLRAAVKTNDYEKINRAASAVLITDKLPEEIIREARLEKAIALEKLENSKEALTQFRLLAQNTQTKEGARAKYEVARIVYEQGKTALAETEIQNFIKTGTSHQVWLGKSFLLLAKINEETGRTFQAKAFLQSIIDNYAIQNDGIIDDAKARLALISKSEDAKFEKDTTNNVELQLNTNKLNDTTTINQ